MDNDIPRGPRRKTRDPADELPTLPKVVRKKSPTGAAPRKPHHTQTAGQPTWLIAVGLVCLPLVAGAAFFLAGRWITQRPLPAQKDQVIEQPAAPDANGELPAVVAAVETYTPPPLYLPPPPVVPPPLDLTAVMDTIDPAELTKGLPPVEQDGFTEAEGLTTYRRRRTWTIANDPRGLVIENEFVISRKGEGNYSNDELRGIFFGQSRSSRISNDIAALSERTWFRQDNPKLTGEFGHRTSFAGRVQVATDFKDLVRQGFWTKCTPQGKVKVCGWFEGGKPTGSWHVWNDAGQLEWCGHLVDGAPAFGLKGPLPNLAGMVAAFDLHSEWPALLALNHAGTQLAVAFPHRIELRDLPSGKLSRTIHSQIASYDSDDQLSFCPDGTVLATRGLNVDVKEPRQVSTQDGNGTWIYHRAADERWQLWNVATGEEIAVLPAFQAPTPPHTPQSNTTVQWHPPATWVGTDAERKLVFWNTATRALDLAEVSGNAPFALSPDGRRLVAMSNDREIKVWDLIERRVLDQIAVDQPPESMALTSELLVVINRREVADFTYELRSKRRIPWSNSVDNAVRAAGVTTLVDHKIESSNLRDAFTGQPLTSHANLGRPVVADNLAATLWWLKSGENSPQIPSLAFRRCDTDILLPVPVPAWWQSPLALTADGKRAAFVRFDNTVVVFDVAPWLSSLEPAGNSPPSVQIVAVDPEPAIAGQLYEVKLQCLAQPGSHAGLQFRTSENDAWRPVIQGRASFQVPEGEQISFESRAILANGQAGASVRREIAVRTPPFLRWQEIFRREYPDTKIIQVTAAHHHPWIAIKTNDRSGKPALQILSMPDGNTLRTISTDHSRSSKFESLAFSSDDAWLIEGNRYPMHLHPTADGDSIIIPPAGDQRYHEVTFSADGQWVATMARSATANLVAVWSTQPLRQLTSKTFPKEPGPFLMTRDGGFLFCGQQILEPSTLESKGIFPVEGSSQARWTATPWPGTVAAQDRESLSLVELPGKTPRSVLRLSKEHGEEFFQDQAKYACDGRFVVSVGRRGARIFDSRDGSLLRKFTAPNGSTDGAEIANNGRFLLVWIRDGSSRTTEGGVYVWADPVALPDAAP